MIQQQAISVGRALHGTGLSLNALRPRQKIRDPLLKLIMSTKKTRIQLEAKRIYAKMDTLNDDVLNYLYGGIYICHHHQYYYYVSL
jgi:hypothetical protein